METRAIFFDLGDTLFNYGRPDLNAFFLRGARLSYNYLQQLCPAGQSLPPFRSYHRRHISSIKWHYYCSTLTRREFDCRELLYKKALRMGLSLETGHLTHLAALWYQPLGELTTLEPGLADTLQELCQMGLQLAIISNTFIPAAVLDSYLEKYGLIQFFPHRIYSCDTVYRKPHRRIYEIALQRLEVSPAHTVMVGDKLREDVKGPGRLGIRGILKIGEANKHRKIPPGVEVIHHIAELPGLLNN